MPVTQKDIHSVGGCRISIHAACSGTKHQTYVVIAACSQCAQVILISYKNIQSDINNDASILNTIYHSVLYEPM